MKLLDTFAGIGGFSLAAHQLGWETVGFVEKEEFPQKVLAKNFPGVPIHDDIFTFDGTKYRGAVDVISGGFPCQPFSQAGKREGSKDERHLFPQMLRVISEVRPRWVVAENVRGLLSIESGRVFAEVISSLESENYEVTTFCIPASALGAWHRRDRLWIVAHDTKYTRRKGSEGRAETFTHCNRTENRLSQSSNRNAPDSNEAKDNDAQNSRREYGTGQENEGQPKEANRQRDAVESERSDRRDGIRVVANAGGARLQGRKFNEAFDERFRASKPFRSTSESNQDGRWQFENWLEAASQLCALDDGVSERLDCDQQRWVKEGIRKFGQSEMERTLGVDLGEFTSRIYRTQGLKAGGNSIYVPIAYEIFRAIEQAENETQIRN